MRKYMIEALKEAEKAYDMGEVPVGAVIVRDGEIIARGHNRTEKDKDPTAHAEILVIREAAKKLGGWRLIGCSMYVTVEPCCMCAGAIVWARLEKLVVAAADPKAGACGSVYDIPAGGRLNHTVDVEFGMMQAESEALMKSFFRELRERKRLRKEEIRDDAIQ